MCTLCARREGSRATPPTTGRRPASPRCSRRAPRTRCAISSGATAGSSAPTALGDALQAARLVSRAELALEERDFGAARDALRSLHGAGPEAHRHHAHAAARRARRRRLGRGAAPRRRSSPSATPSRRRSPRNTRCRRRSSCFARSADDAGAFERRWRDVPPRDRVQPRIAARRGAPRHRARQGRARARDPRDARSPRNGRRSSSRSTASCPRASTRRARARRRALRIERAERWLLERERDAQLLATLGRLCAQAELWGKARSFLEASLSFEESRAAHLELARLAERLGQAGEAQRHFRRAAELALDPVPRLEEFAVQLFFRRAGLGLPVVAPRQRAAAATSGSTRCGRPTAGRTACRGRRPG